MLLSIVAGRGIKTAKPHGLRKYALEMTVKDLAVETLREDSEDVV